MVLVNFTRGLLDYVSFLFSSPCNEMAGGVREYNVIPGKVIQPQVGDSPCCVEQGD